MRTSQAFDSRHAKFNEIKDLQYFRQIIRSSSDIQLKEMLPNYVFRVNTKYFDHENFIYLLEKPFNAIQPGKKLSPTIASLPKRVSAFKIAKNIDLIFTMMIPLNIPVLDRLKSHQRFSCLALSQYFQYPFNRVIKKKGELVDGLFYIIDGQIALIQNGKIKQLLSKGSFFGLKQCLTSQKQWKFSLYSHSNETKLWFIGKEGLETKIDSDEIILRDYFQSFYHQKLPQITERQAQNKLNSQRFKIIADHCQSKKNSETLKKTLTLSSFMKRCEDFKNLMKMDTASSFDEYIKKKKIVVKLQETINISRENLGSIKKSKYDQLLKSSQSKLMKTCRTSYQNISSDSQANWPPRDKNLSSRACKDLQIKRFYNQVRNSKPSNQPNQLFAINALRISDN